MIKRGSGAFEYPIEDINGTEHIIQVTWRGYSDPGRVYGPPEHCYPPEGEMELDYKLPDGVVVENEEALREDIEVKAWEELDYQRSQR